MIGIRADANRIIATGHMMRCITIARQLIRASQKVVFFVADEESKKFYDLYATDLADTEVVVLGSTYSDMEGEVDNLKKELAKRDVKLLLVDSYSVTGRYFEELGRVCSLAYIDDLGERAYRVDILINYSGYYKMLNYSEMYSSVTGPMGCPTELLLGLEYAPLREQFFRDEASDNEKEPSAREVLLTAGGGDMHGMLFKVLESAKEKGLLECDITWNVVLGNMVGSTDKLKELTAGYRSVVFHKNVKDMAGLMKRCTISVAAAGTMLTECAAIGLPTVFYQVADNQKYNVEFWQKTGGMIFAGDVTDSPLDNIEESGRLSEDDPSDSREKVASCITDNVKILMSDKEKLSDMERTLLTITDGRGAKRIAKALLTKSNELKR